ncbi:MAG TPA: hypothetical protein VF283_21495 [Bryobacteraceae bacterium]
MSEHFSRNYRHWLWLDGVILIFDDLMAHEEGIFDWLLHYQGSAARDGNHVSITNGRAKVDVFFVHPRALDVHEEEGLADHEPNKKVPYFSFRTQKSARVQKFITAIIPHQPQNTSHLPVVEPLTDWRASGIRVRSGQNVTDVYLNLQADGRRMNVNSNNTIAGWETDAYLLAWTRPAAGIDDPTAVSRFFVACGSYLRRNGDVQLDSLSKVFAVWKPGTKEAQVLGQEKRKVALGNFVTRSH